MSDKSVTADEGRVLWFLQSTDPVADPKSLVEKEYRCLVDALIAKGLLKQVWILSEEGHRLADKAWAEHEKNSNTASFRL